MRQSTDEWSDMTRRFRATKRWIKSRDEILNKSWPKSCFPLVLLVLTYVVVVSALNWQNFEHKHTILAFHKNQFANKSRYLQRTRDISTSTYKSFRLSTRRIQQRWESFCFELLPSKYFSKQFAEKIIKIEHMNVALWGLSNGSRWVCCSPPGSMVNWFVCVCNYLSV